MDLPFSLSFHLSERPLLFFLTQVSIYHTPASEQRPEAEEEGEPLLRCSGQHLWQQLPSNPSIFLDLTPFQKYLHLFSCLMKPPALPALAAHSSWSVMTCILHRENSRRGPTHHSASSPTHPCSRELWLLLLPPLKKEVLPCSLWIPVSTCESSLLTQSPLSCIFQCPLLTVTLFLYLWLSW